MKRLRSKLTYANVISTLALFLVLAGGTAYAAKHMLPKNSVGTKQLKNGAVTGAKIGKGAVTAASIAPGAITVNPATLGTVPSATNAAHATSADNAATVGGQTPAQIAALSKLRCPVGTILAAGLCFEGSRRPATEFFTATQECSKEGLIFPTVNQMEVFMDENAGMFSGTEETEWAGQAWRNGSEFEAMLVVVNNSEFGPTGESSTFRCASPPTN